MIKKYAAKSKLVPKILLALSLNNLAGYLWPDLKLSGAATLAEKKIKEPFSEVFNRLATFSIPETGSDELHDPESGENKAALPKNINIFSQYVPFAGLDVKRKLGKYILPPRRRRKNRPRLIIGV
jgi:hypothetical protein